MSVRALALAALGLAWCAVPTAAFLVRGGGAASVDPATLYMINASAQSRFQVDALAFETPTAGQLAEVSRILLPTANWPCENPRFAFTAYAALDTHVEHALGNSYNIDGATLEYPAGTFTTITFGGNATTTVANGSQVISDPVPGITIPANSAAAWIRTLKDTPSGGQRLGWYATTNGAFGTKGEAVEVAASASSLSSLLTGGTITGATFTADAFGPMVTVCQGWDGSPVSVLGGDSILYGQGDSQEGNGRGVYDWASRGLDDSTLSTSQSFFNMGTQGESEASSSEGGTSLGQYGYHIQLLTALAALNPGNHWPFTTFISEHFHNDTDLADAQAWWKMLHQAFPGIHLVQTTIVASTFDTVTSAYSCATAGEYCWTDAAHQESAGTPWTYPGGEVWNFNTFLTGGTESCPSGGLGDGLSCVDGVIDIQPEVVSNGLWAVPSFTSTVSQNAAANTKTIHLSACPSVGDSLVLNPGGSTVENNFTVTAASMGTDCTVTMFSATANAHNSGEPVGEAFTGEGDHPSFLGHSITAMGLAVINAKNSGTIK